ncbi:MAG TPA: hypothetical protein VFE65_16760 [Pseudonocardia sp.]|jgi:hypothetical protein|nr:hypothetical protein [Pseudonocardia sp.]
MPLTTVVDDALTRRTDSERPPGWFDRFYFNAHSGTATPLLMVGAGVYPESDLADGYAVAVTDREQINVRVSRRTGDGAVDAPIGPLSWEVLDPLRSWRVRLADNPSGLTFDLTWTARTEPWECEPITMVNSGGDVMTFDHAFQSGFHRGWYAIDGDRTEVEGWIGQRDRSRGRRMAANRKGMHLWIQAQFAEESIAFIHHLDRDNRSILLDGGILTASGVDPITEVEHDLQFTDGLDLRGGSLLVTARSGRQVELTADASVNGGGFLLGGGYGSFHGVDHGAELLEHERWQLSDPALIPRDLSYQLTDRLTAFSKVENGRTESGAGIFEFAHSRSSSYHYLPSRKQG